MERPRHQQRPEGLLPALPHNQRRSGFRATVTADGRDRTSSLRWAVNIGSIELHTSLHLRERLHSPTALALDLDPGEGVGLLECCAVALRLRGLFAGFGLEAFAKTSGSKGLQVYVPLNSPTSTYAKTNVVSRQTAELLEAQTPERVAPRIARALRPGKVLIDWSQNTEHKSIVCAYSVRARRRPTVSMPVTWGEIEGALAAGDPDRLVFEMPEVLQRVAEQGDLFEPVLALRQEAVQNPVSR